MPPETGPVTVQYFKYPDTPHWRHEMVRLGEDTHGVWLGAPMGTIVQRGEEPAMEWKEPFVQLVPYEKWWSLIYNGAREAKMPLYVDITTPACWTGAERVEMIDLDLDVVLFRDGAVEVLDRDEFDEHRDRLRYPDHLVTNALEATEEVRETLSDRGEPFGQAAASWFQRVA